MFRNRTIYLTIFGLSLFLLANIANYSSRQLPLEIEASSYFEEYYLQIPQILAIDTRSGAAFKAGHISGALSDPSCQERNFGFLFSFQPVLIIGEISPSVLGACRKKYKRILTIIGGIQAWAENGYPVSTGIEQAVVLKKGCSSIISRQSRQECL